MGLAEVWARNQQDYDDALEAAHEQDERRADSLRDAFDDLIKNRDINAETGMKYMPRLIDVMSEVSGLTDESIFEQMMQALVHCAAKGQIEAVEAMEKVKQYFVEQVMGNA